MMMRSKRRTAFGASMTVGTAAVALTVASLVAPLSASAAPPPVTASTAGAVYDNIPHPTPGNVSSEAFEAQSVSEFGTGITMTHGSLSNPVVTVLMSSWGCQAGHWYDASCQTTPGATFAHPITLKVYAAGASTAGSPPGALLMTQTNTFNIPYRPSKDDTNCTGADAGKWYDSSTGTCFNGFATPIQFKLSGFLFPAKVVVSVAYNTTDYGAAPIGPAPCNAAPGGCGYDALNVALNASPSVGSYTVPNTWYLRTSWPGATCAPPSVNTFSISAATCVFGQAAIMVQASTGTVLKANPSIAQVLPGLRVYLTLSARLTTSAGNPVVGEPIKFTAAGRNVCTGITNGNGVAACGGLLTGVVRSVLSFGYRATFAGDGVLRASSAHGSLIVIG